MWSLYPFEWGTVVLILYGHLMRPKQSERSGRSETRISQYLEIEVVKYTLWLDHSSNRQRVSFFAS